MARYNENTIALSMTAHYKEELHIVSRSIPFFAARIIKEEGTKKLDEVIRMFGGHVH